MRTLPLALIIACGCGRVGFDDIAAQDANEGLIDGGGLADAETVDAAPRFATGPFGTPALVDELSDPARDDDDPSLTGDMLEIYFKRDSGPPTGFDIYVSTRLRIADDWSTPVRVDELSSNDIDNTPEVSVDGLTMYFSSDREGVVDVYRSTRTNRATPWGQPSRVPELSSEIADFAATTDGPGLNLTMTRFLGGSAELLKASRATTSDLWSEPTVISELSSDLYEADACLDESGLHIFYAATTIDDTVGRQLFTARRSSTEDIFGTPIPLEGVNTSDDDEDPWLSPDLTTMYFVRRTDTGQDIYVATRPLDP